MLLCDLALSYADGSGGIRTYIDNKRKYVLEQTDHRHLLIVPGGSDAVEHDGRATKIEIASPLLPGGAPYRLYVRPDRIRRTLDEFAPDAIELANFFVSPWAAFSHRKHRPADSPCVIGGYFHTDIADAYVAAPLHNTVAEYLGGWSQLLANLGEKFADAAESGMREYIHSVFSRCDLMFAASEVQVARLAEYGVERAEVIPLGVDLDLFTPAVRSEEVRRQFDAGPETLILIYGGRLVAEKHIDVLLEAFQHLPPECDARMLILGEGSQKGALEEQSRHLRGVSILPYETDPASFARVLASADIYVSAGPHETFGLSVAEAQAAGLPVVGVEGGALTERVTHDTGRLGPVDDAEAMARNIMEVAENRSQMSRQARRFAEASYDWSRGFQELLARYENKLRDLRR